jgi:putative endopeptidase
VAERSEVTPHLAFRRVQRSVHRHMFGRTFFRRGVVLAATGLALTETVFPAAELSPVPLVPRFSTNNLDRAVDPTVDFYKFACGTWLKNNPVPADKARWAGFDELQERNFVLVRDLLEQVATNRAAPEKSSARLIGDFFRSAMDTNRLEQLGIQPLRADFERIQNLGDVSEGLRLLARLHLRGQGAVFALRVAPDPKNSSIYALLMWQGGLGLPDRDYYLSDEFQKQREAYRAHIVAMFKLAGDGEDEARSAASDILELETELAKASRTRVELRDDLKNYHKLSLSELQELSPDLPWDAYFETLGVSKLSYVVVGQPEFFRALNRLVQERDAEIWARYLRWHLLRSAAPFLNATVEQENFAFYGTILRGQPQPEPRWQRAAKAIDGSLGEALGQLYVARHFPPEARERMAELVANLKEVFRDRLAKLEWMSEPTRQEALKKFERFSTKIGHPDKFRDYSSVEINADDYFGNVQRATTFEVKRQLARIGQPVDKTEWGMTPQTVNAYFSPLYNEIVFPAGILQPPFFDPTMDDAVNYGAIGAVIGHEITHGYDDQGRKYDAEGNLRDWWTESDVKEFERRTRMLVSQYGKYEALPGQFVNGQLTLGENIADLGGTSIAFEALERDLARHPERRRNLDGFTPEQRFFLSFSQIWRVNWREAELRRRLVVDPHSPAQFRGIGPHVNTDAWYDAWKITDQSPLYRPPAERAKIW